MREKRVEPVAAAGCGAAAELESLLADYERTHEAWRSHLDKLRREFDQLERQRRTILAAAVHCATVRDAWNGSPGREVLLKLPSVLAAYERNLLQWALLTTRGNQKQAAALLGIRGTTLHEKMKRLGLRHRPHGATRHGLGGLREVSN
jgi:DNA-binding NtrC family response regulator